MTLETFIIAYYIVGAYKITDVLRRSDLVYAVYRSYSLPVFIFTYTLAMTLWFPTFTLVTITKHLSTKGK